ncbi:MAG: TetR/AcrR family transcriptional regulator [bacterium]|nr:TetR/AcrR family transcriptional regulator [bacterium]
MNSETKQLLLNVTRGLVDTSGVEAVSMREVGKLAGLSRTALYRHFENKESLLATIVVENFIVLKEEINKLEGTVKNSRELLIEIFVTYYDFGLENPGHYQLMFNTKWDDTRFPGIHHAAYSVFQKVSFFVSEAASGLITDPKILIEKTAILYAFIHGLVELHLIGHTEISKGLDDAKLLIHHMVESILKS